jgi:xylulokinase
MDRRADALIRDVASDLIRDRCGLVRDGAHLGAKIRLFARAAPEIAARAAFWHQPVSYAVHALTGRAVIDHALASTSMLYDLRQKRFAPDLCALFGADPTKLPELADMAGMAGPLTAAGAALTGLPAGLPVAVGTGDDFTSALGAGVLASGPMLCQVGTAEVVGALHPVPLIDGGLLETHAFLGGMYFLENPGWLSGGAIAWACRLLGLPDAASLDVLAAQAPPGASGVRFEPALTGAMAPAWNANLRGAITGLSPDHGASYVARAVLEGCAFAMRDVFERLSVLGVAADTIRFAGGGAASRLWAQIRADVAQRPVEVAAATDAAPVGAALLGACAAGHFAAPSEAREFLGRTAWIAEPDPALGALYAAAHDDHLALHEALSDALSRRERLP